MSASPLPLQMKLQFLASLLLTIAVANLRADETTKNYATQPVLHPGTEARHESFNVISKKGEAQLVFLGDSITNNWEKAGKEVWDKYWGPLNAANFGIGGDRTEHVLWRLDHGNF